jgi:hypothetical protein
LSELLDEIAGEPVQVEVSAMRVLFELLRFLLKQRSAVGNIKIADFRNSFDFPLPRSLLRGSPGSARPDSSAGFRLQ